MDTSHPDTPPSSRRFGGLKILGLIVLSILVTIVLTAWWMNNNIYASPFSPTQLSPTEQDVLASKMAHLTENAKQPTDFTTIESPSDPLKPEPYREDASKREIQLSEKELNALIAKDPDTAKHVAVDLSDGLISVKLLVPMDRDFPVLGGKTLKLNFGVVLKYENQTPVVAIRGMSLGGVPLPQSWWGDIKNVNLVEKFGAEGGFWDQFAKGVEHISVQEGQFRVKLKE